MLAVIGIARAAMVAEPVGSDRVPAAKVLPVGSGRVSAAKVLPVWMSAVGVSAVAVPMAMTTVGKVAGKAVAKFGMYWVVMWL